MAMRQLRRLDAPTPNDPFRKAQRGVVRHVALSEQAFRALERERPELIVADGDAVLIGQPYQGALSLQYAFPNRDAFARLFTPLFERLLPAIRQEEAPLGIRFRLTNRSDRPYLEPLLSRHAFELSREWMKMRLFELPDETATLDEISPGFTLRDAVPNDAEAIVELDAAALPLSALTPQVVRHELSSVPVLRMLAETATGRAVGFLRLRKDRPATGHVADIAVHPERQRRGLGEAMTRWALAWFRREGLRQASLTVSTDNAPAIALYRKLGFTSDEMGFDYRRPIDEDEVRQVLEKRRGTFIRFKRRS